MRPRAGRRGDSARGRAISTAEFPRPEAGAAPPAVSLSIFLTDLGWFGLVGSGEQVAALTIGHASADGVRRALVTSESSSSFPDATSSSFPGSAWERNSATLCVALTESDWHPDLRRRLEAFAAGEPSDFEDVPLALPAMTPFQERVIAETRRVGYGQTLTYGELAARSGAPRAARAVGTVMSTNRIPILIPCHRVVASGGGFGGYSAPQGVELKRRLLGMESAAGRR